MMHSSEDRSAAARTSSGSLSRRENIVGTICECVMRYLPTRSRNCAGSNFSMITDVPPSRIVPEMLACGAEWYSGAGER